MPPTTVTFGPVTGVERLGAPVVSERTEWADPWVDVDHLYPEDVVWCCAPAMPTATLRWDYGRLRYANSPAGDFETVDKLRWEPGRYVRIAVPCEIDVDQAIANKRPTFVMRYWYGIVEQIIDEQHGAHEREITVAGGGVRREWITGGTQRVLCVGLEQLLARHRIRTSFFDRGAGVTSNDSVIAFNDRAGRGNRGTVDYDGANVFYYDLDALPSVVNKWSTQHIVKYLLRRQTPLDHTGTRRIKFRLSSATANVLPDWDSPYIEQENSTTLSLLQRLISKQRLTTFWFDVVSDGGTDYVELQADTITPKDVPITAHPGGKIPAATSQVVVEFDRDPATIGTVRDSGLQVFDVVVAQGVEQETICTLSHADSTLANHWLSGDQLRYQYAATTQTNYAASPLVAKQKFNEAVRSDPRLENVFARFRLPPTWDQLVGDGVGGAKSDAFPGDAGPVPIYYPAATFATSLPMYPSVDYSADRVQTGAAVAAEKPLDRDRIAIQSYWRRPKADEDGRRRWYRGERIGQLCKIEGVDPEDAERIVVHAHVVHDSHSIVLRVSGAPQHAIAWGDFQPLPEDEHAGEWSYKEGNACVTVAIKWGVRVEGQYPDIPPAKEALRYLVIDAGDQYERHFVAPSTVVGVDDGGQLVRSTGGWLERPAKVRDQLRDMARLAHAWYSVPHLVLTIDSRRLLSNDSISLGDLITRAGDAAVVPNGHTLDVNASVSEIRITWEQADSELPPGPRMTIQTFAGELDALSLAPRPMPAEPVYVMGGPTRR